MKSEITDAGISLGKLNSIYRGIVEDNNDPTRAGRCRIRIFGLHTASTIKNAEGFDGIPVNDLPWAEAAGPIFGGNSGVGIFGVPNNGSHVYVFFERGELSEPRYFATALGIPYSGKKTTEGHGFCDPKGEHPTPDEVYTPDHQLGGKYSDPTKLIVIQGHSKHQIVLDSTPNSESIVIKHGKTGAYISLDYDGNIQINATTSAGTKGVSLNESTGDKNTTITGTYALKIAEDMQSNMKNYRENIAANKDSIIGGSKSETILATWDVKSKDTNINTSGETVISSSGEGTFATGEQCLIKSSNGDIKINAIMKNIEMKALLQAKINAMIIKEEATLTADFCGLLTTVGGGKSVLTRVSGKMIMIG